MTLRYLPGTGGHNPADGFAMGGDFTTKDLPSVLVASLATLILDGVLGPEMQLVVVGMVVATTIVRQIKKDAPKQAVVVIGAAGSFAAISTLLGAPVGAFLLLEAAGIGGGLISVILLPGLVASGVGALVFVALSHATGTGVATLAVPHLPAIGYPTGSQFGWAIGIGLLAAPAGTAIRRLAFQIQPFVARHKVLVTPVAGLAIGGLAVLFAEETGKSSHFVLFSGQSDLAPLVQHAATWSAGALVLLIVCKGLAFGVSMGSFKDGPAFPGMFLGAAIGIALSHLPGLPLVDGVAMGIGAMTVVAVGGLPLSSVVLTLVFIQSDAFEVISVVIIAADGSRSRIGARLSGTTLQAFCGAPSSVRYWPAAAGNGISGADLPPVPGRSRCLVTGGSSWVSGRR